MTAIEIRRIPSCPHYFATSEGRIFSTIGWRGRSLNFIASVLSGGKRYPAVRVMVDGRRRTVNVHRLVAEAFHGPCPDGLQVRHLDGDRTNNHPDNLRYGTPAENCADRIAHGTQARGEQCISNATLARDQVIAIRARFAAGEHHAHIAASFGISPNYVHSIARRATWKHVA